MIIPGDYTLLGLIKMLEVTKIHDGEPITWSAWDVDQPNHWISQPCVMMNNYNKVTIFTFTILLSE